MKKIPTLREAKQQYFQQLETIVENATLDELNELSNRIHSGVSQHGCGVWQPEQLTFSCCDNENCQMLAEQLTLWALMPIDKTPTLDCPQGRPDFIPFVFDGKCQRHQRQQIANHYFHNLLELSLSPEEIDSIHNAYARLLEQQKNWANLDELTLLIEQSIKH